MKIIILAGGEGRRLFPLSRTIFPKQFLKIDGEMSLLTRTIKRFLTIVEAKDILIVTNVEHLYHVKYELSKINADSAQILLEPEGRNTAPAVALAMRYCQDELKCGAEEVVFITPSDLVIEEGECFSKSVAQSLEVAQKDYLVTFGIQPQKVEPEYGYIQVGQPIDDAYLVQSFTEKPDIQTAVTYTIEGGYYWNSGMYVATLKTLWGEFEKCAPGIYTQMDNTYQGMAAAFVNMPEISIDYAIAEKSQNVAMIPFTAFWKDAGSWDAIYDLIDKDLNGNAFIGDCVTVDCKNSLFLGKSRMIAGVGLEDVLVVETDDVILVSQRGQSQKVRDIVGALKAQGRKEVDEHRTMYRPWGKYTVLGEGPGYKMKEIEVNPGGCLSLQLHHHRSEHWVVIEGTARVTLGEEVKTVQTNESIFVPVQTKHRLENPGKEPLKIVEVQNGTYLGEDDIVRFDDEYGRC